MPRRPRSSRPGWKPRAGSALTGLQATPFGRYTGARHLGSSGVTTQIGDDRFTSFDTVAAKSRLMFLMILRGEFQDYVINAAPPETVRNS